MPALIPVLLEFIGWRWRSAIAQVYSLLINFFGRRFGRWALYDNNVASLNPGWIRGEVLIALTHFCRQAMLPNIGNEWIEVLRVINPLKAILVPQVAHYACKYFVCFLLIHTNCGCLCIFYSLTLRPIRGLGRLLCTSCSLSFQWVLCPRLPI
jgi:hypothetical protein